MKINVEIKARTNQFDQIKKILEENDAEYKGMDHQIDTYFNSPNGRLKLRQGNIETNLIFYNRPNQAGPKQSDFMLYPTKESDILKDTLSKSMGIKVVVDKKRHIYFIDNIKFHVDEVNILGNFVEIEASNLNHDITKEELLKQCNDYMNILGISKEDLIDVSYSDLMLALNDEE